MVKMKPGFYYLCHPYSAKTEKDKATNFELCCIRTGKLLLKGYNIFSPIVHSHTIETACPEIQKWPEKNKWQFWMDIDIAILEQVGFTGAILAPGWGKSKGCKKEYEWFLSHRKVDGTPYDILKYYDIMGD